MNLLKSKVNQIVLYLDCIVIENSLAWQRDSLGLEAGKFYPLWGQVSLLSGMRSQF